ncbi:hypothetical protein JKP88DRAFT_246141 [Tribonema minus]|uniref:Replication origin-binding protein domain-containing protein n=1 Tax=Tribonema minus TaxID=303371 RepID=A0A835YTY5_9STRA|nr:hypothetical protein JKP88DRAFT_246141 [Tribonema minus]
MRKKTQSGLLPRRRPQRSAAARGGGGGGGGGGGAAYETGSDAGENVEPHEPDLWLEKNTILDSVAQQLSLSNGVGEGKITCCMQAVEHWLSQVGEEELQSALAKVLVLNKAHSRVIFVTQRRAMAHTLTGELRKRGIDTVMYLEVIEEEAKRGKDYAERRAAIKFEPRDCRVLVIEYESLRRLRVKPGAYAYVILDEFRAILNTMNSDTNAESKMTNFARLEALVIAAQRVIYMSADMTVDGAAYRLQDLFAHKCAAVRSDALMDIATLKRSHCDSLRRSMETGVLQRMEEERQARHAAARLEAKEAHDYWSTRGKQLGLPYNSYFDEEFTWPELTPAADHTARIEKLDKEWRAAMEAALAARTPEPVDRSIAPLRRIRRTVITSNTFNMVWRMRADLLKGRRIGVVCSSIRMANTMRELLSEYVTWGSVGLYTSETDNRKDLQRIEETWGVHQVIIFTSVLTTGADFNGKVWRIFTFPCQRCATAMDGLQQQGRFRKCITGEVWLDVLGDDPASEPDSRVPEPSPEVIDRLADEELERMDACATNLAAYATSAFETERLTVGPINSTFAAAMYPLQLAAAYGAVDRRYTQSVRSWITMYKYLALSKGYAWREALALSESAAAEVEEIMRVMDQMEQRDRADEKQLMERLDVRDLARDDGAMRMLRDLINDTDVPVDAQMEFWERYGRALCRAVGDKRVLCVALRLAQTARVFPRAPACELPRLSSDLKAYGNILANIDALRDRNKMLRVSYLHDVMDNEAMELGKPQRTPVLECLVDMLATLGTALDSDRPVRLAQHDAALLARQVKRIEVLGVTHSLKPEYCGASAYFKVGHIMAQELGIELTNGKPPAFDSHLRKLLARQPVFPSAADWFRERHHGKELPVRDGFNPTENTSDDDLKRMMNALRGDPRFTGEFQRAAAIVRSRASQRKRHHAEQSAEAEAFERRQRMIEAWRVRRAENDPGAHNTM